MMRKFKVATHCTEKSHNPMTKYFPTTVPIYRVPSSIPGMGLQCDILSFLN